MHVHCFVFAFEEWVKSTFATIRSTIEGTYFGIGNNGTQLAHCESYCTVSE